MSGCSEEEEVGDGSILPAAASPSPGEGFGGGGREGDRDNGDGAAGAPPPPFFFCLIPLQIWGGCIPYPPPQAFIL